MGGVVGETHMAATVTQIEPSGLNEGQRNSEALKVALASLVGSTIEWYDFFLYGTASALVFGDLFFPTFSPLVGTLLSFSTMAVGYIARPLGAVIMGHFGDKLGRKTMLVSSLVIMGVATTIIGLLPSFNTIGIAAPVILVMARLLQGFAVGGEVGGAITMAVEHAPDRRRGLYGGFPQLGVASGLVLANLIFLASNAFLSADQFKSFGWRIPFLVSVILVLVGVYVRLRVSESPIFKFMKRAGEEIKIPLVTLFGRAWKQILIVAFSTLFTNVMGFIGLIFMLRYATTTLGFTRSTILTFTIIANVIEIPATLYFADLSDRVGRRTIYLWALAFAIVWGAVFFPLVNTAIPAVVFAAILVARLCIAAIFGPQAALFSELFDTNIRYSGISVGYSISSIIGAQTPAIAALLVAATGGTVILSGYIAAAALISFVTALFLWETYKVDLQAKLD
jgi:MFS transporter, MHS family, shikimate and dehydroshikimate transport protein